MFPFEKGESLSEHSEKWFLTLSLDGNGEKVSVSLRTEKNKFFGAMPELQEDGTVQYLKEKELFLGEEILLGHLVFRLVEMEKGVIVSKSEQVDVTLADSYICEKDVSFPELSAQGGKGDYLIEELYSLGLKLNYATSKKELVDCVKKSFRKYFSRERILFFFWNKKEGSFQEIPASDSDHLKNFDNKFSLSRTLVTQVLKEQKPVFCKNVLLDDHFKTSESLHGQLIRSVLCVPLVFQKKILGLFYIDSSKPSQWPPLLTGYAGALASYVSPILIHIGEKETLEEENRLLKSEMGECCFYICPSAKMLKMYSLLERVAPSDLSVLLQGETGTGKEWCARLIHKHSRRRGNKFVALNCAALSKNLLESELFGHEKGAFTGAEQKKKGLVEIAQGGTLFLDEIGEMPLDIQASLLRFLQEKEIRRVGGTQTIKVDVRVIAATNRDLKKDADSGRFRKDLFYRLSGVILKIPPLCQRPEDIEGLIYFFIRKMHNKDEKKISPQVMDALMQYEWPGNVRELKNSLERAFLLSSSSFLTWEDFFPEGEELSESTKKLSHHFSYRESFASFEKEYLKNLFTQSKGNVTSASKLAGLDRTHLYNKLNRYGIEAASFRKS
ncbi:MAG: sigma-54-dependent Fis family transcriptional regulator [Thermodesulfobacteriota bacterium]|nr:sigma-54-dependent Fis family transcriptional regulator [Thermodesulfobacteriota bacterium]